MRSQGRGERRGIKKWELPISFPENLNQFWCLEESRSHKILLLGGKAGLKLEGLGIYRCSISAARGVVLLPLVARLRDNWRTVRHSRRHRGRGRCRDHGLPKDAWTMGMEGETCAMWERVTERAID